MFTHMNAMWIIQTGFCMDNWARRTRPSMNADLCNLSTRPIRARAQLSPFSLCNMVLQPGLLSHNALVCSRWDRFAVDCTVRDQHDNETWFFDRWILNYARLKQSWHELCRSWNVEIMCATRIRLHAFALRHHSCHHAAVYTQMFIMTRQIRITEAGFGMHVCQDFTDSNDPPPVQSFYIGYQYSGGDLTTTRSPELQFAMDASLLLCTKKNILTVPQMSIWERSWRMRAIGSKTPVLKPPCYSLGTIYSFEGYLPGLLHNTCRVLPFGWDV